MGRPVRRKQPESCHPRRASMIGALDDGPRPGVKGHRPEPMELMSMPEDLEDVTAEQLEALLLTPPTMPTKEEIRGRQTAIAECCAMCWKYASRRFGPGTAWGDCKSTQRLRERATLGLRGLRQVPSVMS
jgi:hypothetical protein